MKKILFDLSFIRSNYFTGVAKYAYRILDYIVESGLAKNYILVANVLSENFIRSTYPQFECVAIGHKSLSSIPLLKTLDLILDFNLKLAKIDSNLIFCPWGNVISCWRNKKRLISVVHDMQFRIDGTWRSRFIYACIDDLIVKNSSVIVTISEFSRRQILSFYPNLKGRIVVLGNSVSVKEGAHGGSLVEGNYILYVGRLSKMKNVLTLVKAYARLSEKLPDYRLVLVGKKNDYWTGVLAPEIDKCNLSGRVKLIESCSEAELSALYASAKLFVFPSLREGFGSPPLEAALLRTAVISTKCDALEESTLGVLNYYENPLDDAELADKIMEVLSNYPSREQLENARREILSNFSVSVVGKRICDYLIEYNRKCER